MVLKVGRKTQCVNTGCRHVTTLHRPGKSITGKKKACNVDVVHLTYRILAAEAANVQDLDHWHTVATRQHPDLICRSINSALNFCSLIMVDQPLPLTQEHESGPKLEVHS